MTNVRGQLQQKILDLTPQHVEEAFLASCSALRRRSCWTSQLDVPPPGTWTNKCRGISAWARRCGQKLMRSFSVTSGRFSTSVWMEPTYSPMMPRAMSWMEPRKNKPSTTGATPTVKFFQYTSL